MWEVGDRVRLLMRDAPDEGFTRLGPIGTVQSLVPGGFDDPIVNVQWDGDSPEHTLSYRSGHLAEASE